MICNDIRLQGHEELTTRKISCTENRAWELTALAMRLSEASGAYRGQAGGQTYVFINFGKVTLEKPQ